MFYAHAFFLKKSRCCRGSVRRHLSFWVILSTLFWPDPKVLHVRSEIKWRFALRAIDSAILVYCCCLRSHSFRFCQIKNCLFGSLVHIYS